MQVKLTQADRTIATTAREILFKELEKAGKLLNRVGLATMMVDAEKERVQELTRELMKQTTLKDPNIPSALCGCQVSALAVYFHDLEGFRKKQVKLSLDTGETAERQRVIKMLGCRFGGQEDLFTVAEEEEEEAGDDAAEPKKKGKGKTTAVVKAAPDFEIELPFMGGARVVPKQLGAGDA